MRILTCLKNLMALKGACLVFLLAFMPNLFTHAQTQPCVPDCPNSSWNGPQTVTLNNWTYKGVTIACEVEVTYFWRNACGTWRDFQITNINIINGSGCPFDVNNQTTGLEIIYQKLLLEVPNIPPSQWGHPSKGNCNTNWRVTHGECWRNVEGGFEPCDLNTCCLIPYRICKDDCGNVTVEKTGGSPTSCDSDACDPVCDY